MSDSTTTVAAVVIEKMAPLDYFGPLQAFNLAFATDPGGRPDLRKPRYRSFAIGHRRGLVRTGHTGTGPAIDVEHTFVDAPSFDILLVPGGTGTRRLVDDRDFIQALGIAAGRASIVASVCTGAALLARAGLLDGKRATTNKTAWDFVTGVRPPPAVTWECCPRWVDLVDADTRSGIITSGGVSAGTDMTLALIEKLDGPWVAKNTTELMEWNRETDPENDQWGRRLCAPGTCPPPDEAAGHDQPLITPA